MFERVLNMSLITQCRRGSRDAATSKMERFVIIVNGFQPLTIITKRSILDIAAALDLPVINIFQLMRFLPEKSFTVHLLLSGQVVTFLGSRYVNGQLNLAHLFCKTIAYRGKKAQSAMTENSSRMGLFTKVTISDQIIRQTIQFLTSVLYQVA